MTRDRNKGRRGGSGVFERGWSFQLTPTGTDGRRRAEFTGLRSPGGVGPHEMFGFGPSAGSTLQAKTAQGTDPQPRDTTRCDEPTDSSN